MASTGDVNADRIAMGMRLQVLEQQLQMKADSNAMQEMGSALDAKFLGEEHWKQAAKEYMDNTKAAVELTYQQVCSVKQEIDGIVGQARVEFEAGRDKVEQLERTTSQQFAEKEADHQDITKAMGLIKQQWANVAKIEKLAEEVKKMSETMARWNQPSPPPPQLTLYEQFQGLAQGELNPPGASVQERINQFQNSTQEEASTTRATREEHTISTPPPPQASSSSGAAVDPWAAAAANLSRDQSAQQQQQQQQPFMMDYSRLFDPKLTQSYQFDGRSNRDE